MQVNLFFENLSLNKMLELTNEFSHSLYSSFFPFQFLKKYVLAHQSEGERKIVGMREREIDRERERERTN